jgi:isoleucyl-tRNA synthetase
MITETCYQNMIRAIEPDSPESLHLTDYPVENEALIDEQLVEDMDTIAKLHKLALSAREKARIKIRQPLSRLLIAPNSNVEKRAVNRFPDLLKDGLNVKQVDLLDVKAECPVELHVMPNKRALGQTYKAKTTAIVEQIERQRDVIADRLKQNLKEFELEVRGETITLTTDDLLIEEVDPQNLSIVRFNDGWLAFDVELTEDLRLEGLMRDFLRQMQVLRKEVGLEIEDRISVRYYTASSRMKTAIEQYQTFLCDELLCVQLREHTELSDGKNLTIAGESLAVDIQKVE